MGHSKLTAEELAQLGIAEDDMPASGMSVFALDKHGAILLAKVNKDKGKHFVKEEDGEPVRLPLGRARAPPRRPPLARPPACEPPVTMTTPLPSPRPLSPQGVFDHYGFRCVVGRAVSPRRPRARTLSLARALSLPRRASFAHRPHLRPLSRRALSYKNKDTPDSVAKIHLDKGA